MPALRVALFAASNDPEVNSLAGPLVRDFGCGFLTTIARGGSASLHRFVRGADHPSPGVEHEYPSHSLVFTDAGEWDYHGTCSPSVVNDRMLVAGASAQQYGCTHARGTLNECFVVTIATDALEEDALPLFRNPLIGVTPGMIVHKRAILQSVNEPERLESLAFSLFDLASRESGGAQAGSTRDVRMIFAKRLMQEFLDGPLTMAQVARELHLSRFTFARRFRAAAGMAPYAYLSSLRIERSKRQLASTKLSIDEIAQRNGYCSIAHFSSAFHRIVGCSPTTFRKDTSAC